MKLRSRRSDRQSRWSGWWLNAAPSRSADSRLPREWFRAIVETAGVGLGLVDAHGIVCYVNPWLAELIGRPAEQLVGRSVLDLLHPAGQAAARAGLARHRAGRTDRYLLETAGGAAAVQVIGAPFRGADGTVTGSVIVVVDETARCRAEAELTRLAVTDALTGLPNRAALQDRLGQALARRHRQQQRARGVIPGPGWVQVGQRPVRARRRGSGAAGGGGPVGRRAAPRRHRGSARRRRVRRASARNCPTRARPTRSPTGCRRHLLRRSPSTASRSVFTPVSASRSPPQTSRSSRAGCCTPPTSRCIGPSPQAGPTGRSRPRPARASDMWGARSARWSLSRRPTAFDAAAVDPGGGSLRSRLRWVRRARRSSAGPRVGLSFLSSGSGSLAGMRGVAASRPGTRRTG